MSFHTPEFGVFLVVVLLAYWALSRTIRARLALLLVASYYFYACWDLRFLGLLGGVTAFVWGLALLLERTPAGGPRGALAAFGVGANLGLLGFWKYSDFLLTNVRMPLALVGIDAGAPVGVVLPVGISFFTFQGISYLVDVHRRELRAERSLFRLALYLAFFPQLVAGPIVRASELLPQFGRPFQLSGDQFGRGLALILLGLGKKVLLADFIAANLVDRVFDYPGRHSSLEVLVAIYGYGIQIYADFSGYSDIAIGAALLFGLSLSDNFRSPYRADGLRDFWRRWHISLSTWLRDYLYIPLGGSRFGRARTGAALLGTMLLGGLWHGASWNFVWWGAAHGVALMVEREVGSRVRLPRALRIAVTLHFVLAAWVLFRCRELSAARALIGQLVAFEPGAANLHLGAAALIALAYAAQLAPSAWRERLQRTFVVAPAALQAAATIGVLYLLRHFAASAPTPFIYFRF